mmetsp:Transcript_14335/g.16482  ORF Transcript_14335/g.16482 Transcript_14335/m.16482 type:complete len:244 (-) Transcript_14335:292-1023(-)
MVASEVMERNLGETENIIINQLRKNCLQEAMGCEAKSEFKLYKGTEMKESDIFASAVEESEFCVRLCCSQCHPYTMVVKEESSGDEIVTLDRPFACAAAGCKCCCYQNMTVSSGGQKLGKITEDCYYCVPSFTVTNSTDVAIHKIKPPTCLGGLCVDCFAEGNPCGKGCCKSSFIIYDAADEAKTDPKGKILVVPKSWGTELFSDANRFKVDLPKDATSEAKGIMIGATVFMNSLFYENNNEN